MIGAELFRGKAVRLCRLSVDDAATLEEWHSDAEFLRLYETTPAYPTSRIALARRVEEWGKDTKSLMFGIHLLEGDVLVGLGGYDAVSPTKAPSVSSWCAMSVATTCASWAYSRASGEVVSISRRG